MRLNKQLNRKLKARAVILLSTIVAGCVGTISGGIKEKDRDTAGTYDGYWQVHVQKAPGLQYLGNWNVSCGDMRRTFHMRVNEGAVSMRVVASAKKAFVSPGGVFKLVIPLNEDAKAAGHSDTTLANGDKQLILTGTLAPDGSESSGYITYGIAEFGYAGCTAKTKFNRTSQS